MGGRAVITVARFSEGVTLRVQGPGTMSESRVVHAFAEQVLGDASKRVVFDLSVCSYVDSTFLGGLVSLYKRYVAGTPSASGGKSDRSGEGESAGRFAIYAPAEQRRLLFSVSRLDELLPFLDALPAADGAHDLSLEVVPDASRDDLARYIVDCHRRLAELGGAEAQAFGRVADALEIELHNKATPPPRR
jgi:hypothetical protein